MKPNYIVEVLGGPWDGQRLNFSHLIVLPPGADIKAMDVDLQLYGVQVHPKGERNLLYWNEIVEHAGRHPEQAEALIDKLRALSGS